VKCDGDDQYIAVLNDGSNGYFKRYDTAWSYSAVTNNLKDARSMWWRRECGVIVSGDGGLVEYESAPLSTNQLDYIEVAVTPGALSRAIAMACTGTVVTNADTDGDGFIEGWEVRYGFDAGSSLEPIASADPDGDGLTNLQEHSWLTDPFSSDTDADGYSDKWEVDNGFNPTDPADTLGDPDNDLLTNAEEYLLGTDPELADTDGDGLYDGMESGAPFITLWSPYNIEGANIIHGGTSLGFNPSWVLFFHPEESTMPLHLSRTKLCQVIFRELPPIPGRDQEV